MDTLISDGASYEVSKKFSDFFRSLLIADYQSEPYHQHQNKAEQCYGTAKHWTNIVMNFSGCPASCWLHMVKYNTQLCSCMFEHDTYQTEYNPWFHGIPHGLE